MIVRPDAITTNFSNIDKTQINTNQKDTTNKLISGESQTPITIDKDRENNKLDDIKQKIENDKYSINLDSTSEKMAQELLQK